MSVYTHYPFNRGELLGWTLRGADGKQGPKLGSGTLEAL